MGRTSRGGAGALVALVMVASAAAVEAKTLRSITIDGDFDDWAEVLLDAPQTVADRSLAQGDPDLPGQSQRDLRGIAWTWDATNLSFYFTRTGSGTNSFNAIFYVDVDHDRLLASSDFVCFFKFSGSSFNGYDLYRYDDGGTPDAMPGDGSPPAGTTGAFVTSAGGTAAGGSSGIRFEASLPWSQLGVAAGTPVFVQPALSANQNLPAGVEDDADLLDGFLTGVDLTPGTTKGAAPGRWADFAHRITNRGSAPDVIDLSIRTRQGFTVEILSDPDGDGDPADGALVARDLNGDGDFTDVVDVRPSPADDVNGDALPDGGALAVDASRDVVLRVHVPPGQGLETEEVVLLTASSDYQRGSRDRTQDRLLVDLITLTPPGASIATSTFSALFPHEACNGSGSARVLDVDTVSDVGWSVTHFSDPDGDGDPSDGAVLADSDGDTVGDLGSVADGECVPLVVSVQVPPSTPGGVRATITVTASDDFLETEAIDVVDTVALRVDVSPDRARMAQAGKTLHLGHVVTNAADEVDSFAVSATALLGSAVDVLDDPDGDGEPDDASSIVGTGPVEGSGGQSAVISRVRIPMSVVHGDVELVTIEAVSDASGVSDAATDTIAIAGTLTYSDALFARPSSEFFGQCATIFVQSFQAGGGDLRFVWRDPSSAIARTSPSLTPYADDSLDDFYNLGPAPALGTWSVEAQRRSGSNWNPVGPSGFATFEVLDLAAGGGRISLVDTGSDIYDVAGEDFVGFSEIDNPTFADVLDTVLDSVVFFDADGDGAPSAGEDWLQPDGTVAPWSPGDLTFQRSNIDLFAGEAFGDRFSIPGAVYTQTGTWTMQVTWTLSCGLLLQVDSVSFTVGCEPPPTFGGLVSARDIDPCRASGVLLSWSPASSWGLGGSGTYAVYRSTDPAFVPSPGNLLVSGIGGLTYVDAALLPGMEHHWIVRAESNVTCSDGPENDGLVDGNLLRQSATDADVADVPAAAFTHSSPECWGDGGGVVTFMDASSGPPTSWSWDFDGDGVDDATGSWPSFDFPGPGTYDVRLSVSNLCGSDSVVQQVVVTEEPLAVLWADRSETCLGEPIDFDGTASVAVGAASLVSWEWDFDGDGATDATGADPAPWTYATTGARLATLRVTDSEGCTDRATWPVEVFGALEMTLAEPVVDHCTGDALVVATPSGGSGPYVVTWDVLTDDGSGAGTGTFALGSSTVARATVTDSAGCMVQVDSAPIVVAPELVAVLEAPVVDPCTGDASVSVVVSGGTPPYVVSWDVLSDDGSGTGNGSFGFGSSTVATATVTDAEGCVVVSSSEPIVVPDELSASFAADVSYVSAGVFAAELEAAPTLGTPPYSYSWDLGDDGSEEGTAPTISFAMAANETRPVRLTVTDVNGCVSDALADVVSGGCPVTEPLSRLMVRKTADGRGLLMSWDASTHACHGRYQVVEAVTPRPSTGTGSWPDDPEWTSLQSEDADGSDLDTSLTLLDARPGSDRYFLVRDGGTDGSFAPTLHYDDDAVGP